MSGLTNKATKRLHGANIYNETQSKATGLVMCTLQWAPGSFATVVLTDELYVSGGIFGQ